MTAGMAAVTAARGWLGTPFRHQGRLCGHGVDCIGLVAGVARALGLAVEDRADYPRTPDGVSLQAALAVHLVPVAATAARPGDVLLFRIRRLPQHVGILTEAGTMVHAYAGAGGVVEAALTDWWWRRLVAVYRFPIGEED